MRWILVGMVALSFASEVRGGEDEELFRKCVDSFHHQMKLLEKVELVYVIQVIRADSFDDLMKGHKKIISLPFHVDYKTNGVSTLCRRHNPGDIEGRLLIRKDDFQIDVSPDQGQVEISETSTIFDGHLWNEFRPILDMVHQCREGGVQSFTKTAQNFKIVSLTAFLSQRNRKCSSIRGMEWVLLRFNKYMILPPQ